MALSWRNLPCALKAAIGIGKRTLGDPRQFAAPQGPQQGPFAGPGAHDGFARGEGGDIRRGVVHFALGAKCTPCGLAVAPAGTLKKIA